MDISQEHERSRNERRNRSQYTERKARRGRKWRVLSYLSVLPIFALTLVLIFIWPDIVHHVGLASGVLLLVFSIVAFVWGRGPTLLFLVLGLLTLAVFFSGLFAWHAIIWLSILQLLPLILVALVIGLLSFQRGRGRASAHKLALTRRQLEDDEHLKERFLSTTSRALETPTTGILTQSQLLRSYLEKPSTETAAPAQALSSVDEHTRFLTSMRDELLDFSRMQSRDIPLQRKKHDLNAICQQVVEDQKIVSDRNILFQRSDAPAIVRGDDRRLAQVVSNLVSNAVKYSPASSPVEVSIRHDVRHVIMQVRDYGPGISQDELAHIFEPFYRTPAAQSSTIGGLGLGLAITKRLVELHQGRIFCISKKNSGSTFFVELPTSE